jgi:hypothetical protein
MDPRVVLMSGFPAKRIRRDANNKTDPGFVDDNAIRHDPRGTPILDCIIVNKCELQARSQMDMLALDVSDGISRTKPERCLVDSIVEVAIDSRARHEQNDKQQEVCCRITP